MSTATLSPGSAKVKFRLAGGAQPLILLPVHVNNRGPFDFILDTGSGTSLLASELAKQLEVKVIGSKEGQSAGGNVSVSLAKVDSLAVKCRCSGQMAASSTYTNSVQAGARSSNLLLICNAFR